MFTLIVVVAFVVGMVAGFAVGLAMERIVLDV
jgi:hypothetical protein